MHTIAQALLMRSPTAPDPYFSSVTLLQHFNGAVSDSSPGNAATLQSGGAFVADGSSINGTMYQWYRDSVSATSNYAEATEAAGFITSNTWTAEARLVFTENPRDAIHNTILHLGDFTTNRIFGANATSVLFLGSGIGAPTLPPIGTRMALALVQTPTTRYAYLDGVCINIVVSSSPITAHTIARVGAQQPIGAGWPDYTCGARIEEVRITNGVARYPEARTLSSSYALQTTPFPNY